MFISQSAARVNSMTLQTTGPSFRNARSARTAIGHDAEGNVLLLGVTGQTWMAGSNLMQMAQIMIESGAINAINLDGGGSATYVINDTVVNTPSDHCGGYQGHHANPLQRCARAVTTIVCIHDYNFRCPRNCSGHGTCASEGDPCKCDDGYAGAFCERLACPGSLECSGHGICGVDGVCSCGALWQGDACNMPRCPRGCSSPYGCTESDLVACSGRGVCAEGSRCVCDPIYIGDACEDYLCPRNCSGNGVCDAANGTCCCNEGFVGEACLPLESKAPFDVLTALFAVMFSGSLFWNVMLWKRAARGPASKGFRRIVSNDAVPFSPRIANGDGSPHAGDIELT